MTYEQCLDAVANKHIMNGDSIYFLADTQLMKSIITEAAEMYASQFKV